jgi:hypothetical protein
MRVLVLHFVLVATVLMRRTEGASNKIYGAYVDHAPHVS